MGLNAMCPPIHAGVNRPGIGGETRGNESCIDLHEESAAIYAVCIQGVGAKRVYTCKLAQN